MNLLTSLLLKRGSGLSIVSLAVNFLYAIISLDTSVEPCDNLPEALTPQPPDREDDQPQEDEAQRDCRSGAGAPRVGFAGRGLSGHRQLRKRQHVHADIIFDVQFLLIPANCFQFFYFARF